MPPVAWEPGATAPESPQRWYQRSAGDDTSLGTERGAKNGDRGSQRRWEGVSGEGRLQTSLRRGPQVQLL